MGETSTPPNTIYQWPWFGIHMQWRTVDPWVWVLVSWPDDGRCFILEVCRLDWELGQGRWFEPSNGDSVCGGHAWRSTWRASTTWRPLGLRWQSPGEPCWGTDFWGNPHWRSRDSRTSPRWGGETQAVEKASSQSEDRCQATSPSVWSCAEADHDPLASCCQGSNRVHWCSKTS